MEGEWGKSRWAKPQSRNGLGRGLWLQREEHGPTRVPGWAEQVWGDWWRSLLQVGAHRTGGQSSLDGQLDGPVTASCADQPSTRGQPVLTASPVSAAQLCCHICLYPWKLAWPSSQAWFLSVFRVKGGPSVRLGLWKALAATLLVFPWVTGPEWVKQWASGCPRALPRGPRQVTRGPRALASPGVTGTSPLSPQILCIHLKRFRHEVMYSFKISSHVSFPLEGLDLRPFLAKECTSQITTYDLLSVICHHGTAGSESNHAAPPRPRPVPRVFVTICLSRRRWPLHRLLPERDQRAVV